MKRRLSRFSLITIIVILVTLGVGLGVFVYNAPGWFVKSEKKPRDYGHLPLGGTSVVSIMLENRWMTAYRDAEGVQVDYESIGSTKGVNGMIDHKYAIGFTHAPITEEQRKKAKDEGGEVVQVPVLLCAVVPIYNIKELQNKPPLKFTGEVLADIFLGNVEWWDAKQLKDLNEGVALPHEKIKVVYRKDSSGTTLIFSEYLSDASKHWRDKFGKGKSELEWPVGEGKERSERVAQYVRNTEGAIGYVDLVVAARVDYGAVQNKDKDKEFIHVETKNILAAGQQAAAKMPDLLNFNVTNMPGKESYPICGVIWAVTYRDQQVSREKQVVEFLRWVNHAGQKFAKVSFAPLPEGVVKLADEKLDSIKSQ